MKTLTIGASLLSMVISTGVMAAEKGDKFIGLTYISGEYKEDGLSTFKPSAISVRAGGYLDDNISVEMRLMQGISADTVDDIDVKFLAGASIFFKGDLPLADNINVYGLLGVTTGKIKARFDRFSALETEQGVSHGVGLEVALLSNVILGVEYIEYLSGSNYTFRGTNLSISRKF